MPDVSDFFHEQVLSVESDFKKGDHSTALRRGRRLLKENPDYVPLLRIVGYAALEQGDLRAARRFLLRAAKHDTHPIRARLSLATILEKQGRYGKAESYLREALEETPRTAKEHQKLVEAGVRLGDFKETIRRASEALDAYPSDPEYASGWRRWLLQSEQELQYSEEAWTDLESRVQADLHDADPTADVDVTDEGQVVAALVALSDTHQLEVAVDLLHKTEGRLNRSFEWKVAFARVMSMRAKGLDFPSFYFEALARFPNNPYGYLMVGRRLAATSMKQRGPGDPPLPEHVQAIDFLLTARMLGEANDSDALLVAELLMGTGQLLEAKRWLEQKPSRESLSPLWQASLEACNEQLCRAGHAGAGQSVGAAVWEKQPRGPGVSREPTTLASASGLEMLKGGRDPSEVAGSFSAYLNDPRVLANLHAASLKYGQSGRAQEIAAYASSAFPTDPRFVDEGQTDRAAATPGDGLPARQDPWDAVKSKPRVLMLTYGTHENDSRVDRAAKTLAEMGYEVVLLAKHRFGLPVVDRRDGYAILRSQWSGKLDPSLTGAKGLGAPRRVDLPIRDFLARLRRAQVSESWPWKPEAGHRSLTSFERRRRGYLAFANTAFEVARQFRPDVIHAHDFNTLVGASLISRVLGTPFVYDTHELWVHRNRGGVSYSKREIRWEESFERQAMRTAAFSVTVCDSIADYLTRRYSVKRPVVVRNIPEQGHGSAGEPVRFRRELGLPDDAFLAVYVGRFTSNRGITDILRALPHTDPRIHVAMLGYFDRRFAVEYHDLVEELGVEARIHPFGPVPSATVSDWIREADISLTTMNRVCLSYTYTLPNKLFESLHAGLPILGPDSPEIVRIVGQYHCGVTYRDGDHLDLASNLNHLESNPSELEILRQGADAAAADLRWETERLRLIDAYHELPTSDARSLEGA